MKVGVAPQPKNPESQPTGAHMRRMFIQLPKTSPKMALVSEAGEIIPAQSILACKIDQYIDKLLLPVILQHADELPRRTPKAFQCLGLRLHRPSQMVFKRTVGHLEVYRLLSLMLDCTVQSQYP